MILGYIGYGEAAYSMSCGFAADGILKEQYACSRKFADPNFVGFKPEDANCGRCITYEELFSKCDTVFVTTPNTAALATAQKAAPYLHEGILYVDMTSSNPKLMEQVAAVSEPTGALFVDGAMLDSLPKFKNKVPIVVAGPGAEELMKRIEGLGMNEDNVGTRPGAASAIKMLRSIYTKGHLGFALEMIEGAAYYGVDEYVMKSLAKTMDGKTFIQGMDGRMSGGILHAGRRAVELDMAADMLDEAGLSSKVARAAADKLREIDALHLPEKIGDYRPKTWKESIDCIMKYKKEEEEQK